MRAAALPFGILVVVLFFALDAVEKGVELARIFAPYMQSAEAEPAIDREAALTRSAAAGPAAAGPAATGPAATEPEAAHSTTTSSAQGKPLGVALAQTEITRAALLNQHLPRILALLFDVLLAVMIVLRTRAGRIWGIIYLVALTGTGIALIVVKPVQWIELGLTGRVRELATFAVNLGLAGVLWGRKARDTLIR